MAERPIRLGPDPSRTHLERWNELHPDRYGKPDSPAASEPYRQQRLHDDAEGDSSDSSLGLMESFVGLAVFFLAPLSGLVMTLLFYQWTRPANLTPASVFGYAGVFVVAMLTGGVLVYALRRVLLALVLAALALGAGYLAWHLWLS